jgi:hypothetical protein
MGNIKIVNPETFISFGFAPVAEDPKEHSPLP